MLDTFVFCLVPALAPGCLDGKAKQVHLGQFGEEQHIQVAIMKRVRRTNLEM